MRPDRRRVPALEIAVLLAAADIPACAEDTVLLSRVAVLTLERAMAEIRRCDLEAMRRTN